MYIAQGDKEWDRETNRRVKMCEREKSWQNKFYMLSYTIEKRFLSSFWAPLRHLIPAGGHRYRPLTDALTRPLVFFLLPFFPLLPSNARPADRLSCGHFTLVRELIFWWTEEAICNFFDSARTASSFIKGWKGRLSIPARLNQFLECDDSSLRFCFWRLLRVCGQWHLAGAFFLQGGSRGSIFGFRQLILCGLGCFMQVTLLGCCLNKLMIEMTYSQ